MKEQVKTENTPNETKPTRLYVNRNDFEKLMILAEALQRPMDFKKKFRVVLEHDPEEVAIEVKYYLTD